MHLLGASAVTQKADYIRAPGSVVTVECREPSLYGEPDWMLPPRGPDPAIAVVPGCKLSSADGGQVHGDHSADRLRPCLRPSALHRRVDRGDGCSRLVPSRDHAVEAACLQAIVAGHFFRCNESPRPRTALAYRLCSLALLLGCAARNRLSSSGESLDRPIVSVTC
jgi:hypothetical protein